MVRVGDIVLYRIPFCSHRSNGTKQVPAIAYEVFDDRLTLYVLSPDPLRIGDGGTIEGGPEIRTNCFQGDDMWRWMPLPEPPENDDA